jgi:hypothetical protein
LSGQTLDEITHGVPALHGRRAETLRSGKVKVERLDHLLGSRRIAIADCGIEAVSSKRESQNL